MWASCPDCGEDIARFNDPEVDVKLSAHLATCRRDDRPPKRSCRVAREQVKGGTGSCAGHRDTDTHKLPGDVIPTRIETLASLPPLVTAAKKSHQHHAIDDNTSPYPVGTLFTVPWINPGETAVSLHPAVTVHVIEPEELSFTWAETLLKTTGILAKGRNTISYYDGKTEKIQEVPEGDLIIVIPSELRTVAIPNVSNDVKSQQLRVVVEQLHKKRTHLQST